MTDNEIIKAYGCCNLNYDECGGCESCPLRTIEENCRVAEQDFDLEREVYNLLNRQKAEIERLNSPYEMQVEASKKLENSIKAEAVKEFAERLKEKLHLNGAVMGSNCAIVNDVDIDNLVKEMAGDDNG